MSVWHRLERAWLSPAPPERLALLRIAVGLFAMIYLLARSREMAGYGRFSPEQFAPVGPVSLLQGPEPDTVSSALLVLTIAAGIAFVLGRGYRIVAPIFALLLLWVVSYRNSWGMVFHTENLLVVHVAILAVSPAADALVYRVKLACGSGRTYGWPVRLLAASTVLTYFIAGMSKLRTTGAAWFSGAVLWEQVAWDNLRKIELGDTHSSLGVALLEHPWTFQPLAIATLVLELAAPLALVVPRFKMAWCGAMWSFHVGVLLFMAIFFPYPLFGLAFLPFFPIERLLRRGGTKLSA